METMNRLARLIAAATLAAAFTLASTSAANAGSITELPGIHPGLLKHPTGVVYNPTDKAIYAADAERHVIFRFKNGRATVYAGTLDRPCASPLDSCGDGGPATSASLNSPQGLAVIPKGDTRALY
jgi:DNA-binding beta-propeller fold protein YncE